jgi:hypothetical protein
LKDGGCDSKCTEWLHDVVSWQDAPCATGTNVGVEY